VPTGSRSLSSVAIVALALSTSASAIPLPPPSDAGPVGARLLWRTAPPPIPPEPQLDCAAYDALPALDDRGERLAVLYRCNWIQVLDTRTGRVVSRRRTQGYNLHAEASLRYLPRLRGWLTTTRLRERGVPYLRFDLWDRDDLRLRRRWRVDEPDAPRPRRRAGPRTGTEVVLGRSPPAAPSASIQVWRLRPHGRVEFLTRLNEDQARTLAPELLKRGGWRDLDVERVLGHPAPRGLQVPYWATDLVLDPTGRYLVGGASEPPAPGHVPVHDTTSGRTVAWVPVHPDRPIADLGWATSSKMTRPSTSPEDDPPQAAYVGWGDPDFMPAHLAPRARRLNRSWGHNWAEREVDTAAGIHTAFLPDPVLPLALPGERAPRFVFLDGEGFLFAWEIHPIAEPEPTPEATSVPPPDPVPEPAPEPEAAPPPAPPRVAVAISEPTPTPPEPQLRQRDAAEVTREPTRPPPPLEPTPRPEGWLR
jgi:hypothetical protein